MTSYSNKLDAKIINLIKSCLSTKIANVDISASFSGSKNFNCYFSLNIPATTNLNLVVADLNPTNPRYQTPPPDYAYNYAVYGYYEIEEFYVLKVVVNRFDLSRNGDTDHSTYSILASEADYNAIKKMAYIRHLTNENQGSIGHVEALSEYYHKMLEENKSINSIDDL